MLGGRRGESVSGACGRPATRRRTAAALVLVLATACSSSDDHDARPEPAPSSTTVRGETNAPVETDWTVYGHDLANTRLSAGETRITTATVGGLEEEWSVDDLVGVTGTPVVADGVAYFGDWTGKVHAVDTGSGTDRWAAQVGGFVVGSPAVDGDAIFVASGKTLFRLDRATGTIGWQVDVNEHDLAQISASPVVVGDVVLQGVASAEVVMAKDEYTFRGSIGAYDVATGAEKWRFYTTAGDATDGPGAGVWSTPAVDVDRGVLYVGSGNAYAEPTGPLADSILAIDIETGALQWSTQFTYPDVFSGANPGGKDADVGASPNLWSVDGHDYVGAGDKGGVYHALDRDTGEIAWETTLTPGSVFGGEIGSGAFVDDRLVVVSNVGDPASNAPTNVAKVFALDPETGDILWEADQFDGLIFGPVSAVPGVAFVGTNTGKLAALDTETGAERWSFQAPAPVGGGASIVDGRVVWGYGFTLFDGPGQGGVLSFTVPDDTTASAARVDASASAGCDATPATPGVSDRTLSFGGEDRNYQLTLPAHYDGRTPLPVVFGLHALTISYEFVPSMVGFDAMQREYDFIGVAPSGRRNGDAPYWFAAPAEPNDDVEFLGALLDELENTLCVDPARVFATGMSNGAQMSSQLACRL
ncbi:MAG TPA: PQQ-binding-like beta-propeller repeat protein, partial [Acidimicrobiia bacterium]|nr:PQQ-binding-like beta-propeller repeat protein [Acidimicrobiia bacterium]